MVSLAASHGGLLSAELEALALHADAVLDLSVNVNPYGPCPALLASVRSARLDRYPDPTARPARLALANAHGVAPERVVVASGAVELLWCLARCLLEPGATLLVVEPTFSELRRAAATQRARIVEHRLLPERDFELDLAALDALAARERPRLAYLCTPANPSGRSVALSDIAELAARHPATRWLVDLSFAELSREPPSFAARESPNLVWLRSLTKELAVPGLRVGFAILSASLASAVEQTRPPWSVSAPAQAAAMFATTPAARTFVAETRTRWLDDRERLDSVLQRLGLRAHPSDTVYSLVALGPQRTATALRQRLLAQHAVMLRDATSFGLPHHVRIAAPPAAQLPRLLQALERELER